MVTSIIFCTYFYYWRVCILVVNTSFVQETLSHKSHFISCNFIFIIILSYEYSFVFDWLENLKQTTCLNISHFVNESNSTWVTSFHFNQPFLCGQCFRCSLGSSFLMISIVTWKENILSRIKVFQFHFSHQCKLSSNYTFSTVNYIICAFLGPICLIYYSSD